MAHCNKVMCLVCNPTTREAVEAARKRRDDDAEKELDAKLKELREQDAMVEG